MELMMPCQKGQTYTAVIYGLKDYHMIALLDGKEGITLKECCVQAVGQFRLLKNLARRLIFGWHYSNKEGWTENNP